MEILFGVIIVFGVFFSVIISRESQQKQLKDETRPSNIPLIPDMDQIRYYALVLNNLARNNYRYESGEISQDEWLDIYADLQTELAELSFSHGISEKYHRDLLSLYVEMPTEEKMVQ